MYKTAFTFLLFAWVISCFAQSDFHQEAERHGCCSEKTRLPYTYDSEEGKKQFLVQEVNKVTEKSLFYEGKFDAWKHNKGNYLYEQLYIIAPGTLPISKGKFLDQTEVANIHYQEFLFYVELDSGKAARPKYEPRMENKYKTKYYNNPEFGYFPVFGVSAESAEAYCKWRALKVNNILKEMLKTSPKKYRYSGRLPSPEEWKGAAGDPNREIRDKHYKLSSQAKEFMKIDMIPNRLATPAVLDRKQIQGYNANFYIEPPAGLDLDIPAYVYSFEPNSKGFYNMFGNVKEILNDGYAIGGSFKTSLDKNKLFEKDNIQAYRTDVGFRCICEVARRR